MNRSGKTQRPGSPAPEREPEPQTVRSVDLYLGAAPLLETRVVEGLVAFGKKHPGWRFSLRQAGFRYTRAWLKRNRTDGVLLAVGGETQEPVLRREGIPYVRLLQPDLRRPEDVMVDDVAIGACGADFFLRQGFRRCVFCGVGTNWSDRRRQGFERRLAGAGVSCAVHSFPFSDVAHWQFGPAADGRLRRLVRSLPTGTAILAAHDALAKRIIDASLREGRRIPQEIAVLGVGNHALLCLVSPVPVSSVETRVPVATFRAAERLEALFAGREIRQPELVTPYGVVARASTRVPRNRSGGRAGRDGPDGGAFAPCDVAPDAGPAFPALCRAHGGGGNPGGAAAARPGADGSRDDTAHADCGGVRLCRSLAHGAPLPPTLRADPARLPQHALICRFSRSGGRAVEPARHSQRPQIAAKPASGEGAAVPRRARRRRVSRGRRACARWAAGPFQ